MNPQHLRKKFRDAGLSQADVRPRKPELRLRLSDSEVVQAAGYWLKLWQGSRSILRGRKRTPRAA
jgi:hypothetical protein